MCCCSCSTVSSNKLTLLDRSTEKIAGFRSEERAGHKNCI